MMDGRYEYIVIVKSTSFTGNNHNVHRITAGVQPAAQSFPISHVFYVLYEKILINVIVISWSKVSQILVKVKFIHCPKLVN